MRHLIAVLAIVTALLAFNSAAYAQCSTQSVVINGKLSICTSCCTGSYCHTTCS